MVHVLAAVTERCFRTASLISLTENKCVVCVHKQQN